jgi:hypothetical protein
MNSKNKNESQRGASSIFITMIILTGMLFVALTINTIVQNGIVMSRAHINSTKAYFAAESGTERMLWQIRQYNYPNPAFNPTTASPVWVSGCCVTLDLPPIDSCNMNCVTGNEADLYDSLLNDSKYKVEYTYNAPTATFTSTGDFEGITKRVVETKYNF